MFSSSKQSKDFEDFDERLSLLEKSLNAIDQKSEPQPKIWSTVFNGTQIHSTQTWKAINGLFCDIGLDEKSFVQILASVTFSGGVSYLNAGFRVVKHENGVKKTFKMPASSGSRISTHFSFQPEKNYSRNLCTVSFSICDVFSKDTTKVEVEMFASHNDTVTINRLKTNDNADFSNRASSSLTVVARTGRKITEKNFADRFVSNFV